MVATRVISPALRRAPCIHVEHTSPRAGTNTSGFPSAAHAPSEASVMVGLQDPAKASVVLVRPPSAQYGTQLGLVAASSGRLGMRAATALIAATAFVSL